MSESIMLKYIREAKHRAYLLQKDMHAVTKAIRWKIDPERRRIRRIVATGLLLPEMPRKRRLDGSVWAVAMVRNEEDIIRATVEHLIAQGVDGILIADNLSTDTTPEILSSLTAEFGIYVASDSVRAYYQAEKMDALARAAARAGADWIVPFDADEWWFGRSHATIAAELRDSRSPIALAVIHNVFPTTDGTGSQTRWRVDSRPARLQKVAFRWSRIAQLHFGNHAVQRSGRPVSALQILHFPWRSTKQLVHKIRDGAAAIDQARGRETRAQGEHWRELDEMDDAMLLSRWEAVMTGASDDRFEWVPRGELHSIDVQQVRRWSDVETIIEGDSIGSVG